jgi:parvulin-like peptidyl-prolyl isomerase
VENAKRLWLTTNSGASLAITCLCLLTLQACSPKYPEPDKNSSEKGTTTDGTKKSDSKSDDNLRKANGDAQLPESDKSKTDSTDKANSTDTKTPADEKANAAVPAESGKSAAAPDISQDPMALFNELPQVKAASEKVDLRKMPDSDVIVSVRGTPVTVGDYKLELKLREGKASALIGNSPQMQDELLHVAAERHITLTDEEKKKLVDTAKKAEKGAGNAIKDYLKENKITSKEFDDRIIKLGLALKTATSIARETLLNEIVDQELLVVAAKDRDFYKKAFNRYIENKQTPEYQQFLNESGLTPEQAQKQVIERYLIDMYIQLIKEANATVSDAEIQKVYDDNKSKLKHGERFRLSQIVLAAPSDAKDQPGIKEQLKGKFPNRSDKDIQAKADEYKSEQKKKAQDILLRIQKGEKFEDMANQYTQDPGNLAAKNGGDIGWKEKDSLEPDFVAKVSTLKPGQVYPHVLTTRFGYHLLELTGKEGAGTVPISDLKAEIQKELVQKKQVQAVADWLSTQHKTPGVIKLSPQFLKLISASPANATTNEKTTTK